MSFELKSLNASHPALRSLDISAETLIQFGAGYAQAGLLRGRLATPIHNVDGILVAYVGVAIDTGEYLYPKTFRLELEVFMLHTLIRLDEMERRIDELCVTPDPLEVIRLTAAARPAIGLMHPKLSDTQEHLLREHLPIGTHLRLLKFLNDRATEHIAGRLAKTFSVTTIDCLKNT